MLVIESFETEHADSQKLRLCGKELAFTNVFT